MSAALPSVEQAGANRDASSGDERGGPTRSLVWLVLAVLLATVLSFVASLAYARRAGAQLDARAAAIATNAVPAIEHLSAARAELLDLLLMLEHIDGASGPIDPRPFELGVDELHRQLVAYRAIPFFPHETRRYGRVRRTVGALKSDVGLIIGRSSDAGAARLAPALRERASRSIERADGALEQLIHFNTEQQRRLAVDIAAERARAARLGRFLDALTLGLALLLVALVLHGVRRYAVLLHAQKQTAEQRARDLAAFSAKLESLSSSSLTISDAIARSIERSTMLHAIADEARSIVHAAQCTLRVRDGEAVVSTRPERSSGAPPEGPSLTVPVLHQGAHVGELVLVREAGERPFRADDERLAGLFAASTGVALENARLYDDAQAATHAREDLLASVSHDLRSPLGALHITTELLREQVGSRDPGAGLVARIDRLIRRMTELVRDLLDAAQIEAGRLEGRLQREDLSAIVHEAAEVIGVAAAERSVRLEVRAEPAAVLCERNLVLRVLGNLLGNALKFSPPGSTITLTTEARDGEIEIAVSDEGTGIPPEMLEHIFDRYWQQRRTDRRGSGLGLYIARGIVEAHGGRIWVESALGEGTTFHFTLRRA